MSTTTSATITPAQAASYVQVPSVDHQRPQALDHVAHRVETGKRGLGSFYRPDDKWNEDPKPYVWAKTADEILESPAGYCNTINASGH